MNETFSNIDNQEIQSIVNKMEQLDKEFDNKSSRLSRKLVDIEEKIENLKQNEQINQKYSSIIKNLESMLEDLRKDWNIDEGYNSNNNEKKEYINIPKWHVVVYKWIINWGSFIISQPENVSDYSKFRLFISKNWEQKEINISNVMRLRDWWTTYIKTDIWKFYFPTPFKKNTPSTFTDNNWNVTNIETWEQVDNLSNLKNISPNDLFEKDEKTFHMIYENYLNESIITDEILDIFKNKVRDYAESYWYRLKRWFKMKPEDWGFIIERKYIEEFPWWEDSDDSWLELFFWN